VSRFAPTALLSSGLRAHISMCQGARAPPSSRSAADGPRHVQRALDCPAQPAERIPVSFRCIRQGWARHRIYVEGDNISSAESRCTGRCESTTRSRTCRCSTHDRLDFILKGRFLSSPATAKPRFYVGVNLFEALKWTHKRERAISGNKAWSFSVWPFGTGTITPFCSILRAP